MRRRAVLFQFPEKVIPLFTTQALAGKALPLNASLPKRRACLHVDAHTYVGDAVGGDQL